jgi:hypothetical protein
MVIPLKTALDASFITDPLISTLKSGDETSPSSEEHVEISVLPINRISRRGSFERRLGVFIGNLLGC